MLRKDFDEVLARNIDFANSDKKGALIRITGISEIRIPNAKPLEDWEFPKQYKEYLDECIEHKKAYWQQRGDLKDDVIPDIKPYYGIAEHSSFIGGEVSFGGNTSYHHTVINDWSDLDKLSLEPANKYFRMLMDSLLYLKERSLETGCVVTLRGGESPMDIANALRGNDLFTDFYDYPDEVHRLLEFCTEAAKWTFKHQLEIIGYLNGGVMSGWGIWMPGNSIGHLSEDASTMCAVSIYEEFGKPYTVEALNDYDCSFMHTHPMGRHVLPSIASIDKIKFIEIEYDPNQMSPIEVYKSNEAVLKDKIVVLRTKPEEIQDNLEFLSSHKSIVELNVESFAEAEKAISLVRSISPI